MSKRKLFDPKLADCPACKKEPEIKTRDKILNPPPNNLEYSIKCQDNRCFDIQSRWHPREEHAIKQWNNAFQKQKEPANLDNYMDALSKGMTAGVAIGFNLGTKLQKEGE